MTTTKKNRVRVEIEKSTKKAHLIVANNRKAWVQKRWVDVDLTVSEKTFNRQADEFEARNAMRQQARETERDFKNELHSVRITRESEKAIACVAGFEDGSCTVNGERFAWFPKTQVKEGNKIPGWLILAKARELGASLIGGQNHLSIIVNEIGGVEINETITPSAWS